MIDEIIPKGRTIAVTMTVVLPDDAIPDQICDWVWVTSTQSGTMRPDNPLRPHGFEVIDAEWGLGR